MDVPKTIHLHNLAHFNALCPISAKHSISSDFVAYENGLTYPGADTHCDHCGVYLISGLTCSTRIAFKKTKAKKLLPKSLSHQKQYKRSRTLHTTCLVCQYTKKSDTLLNERVNKHATKPVAVGNEETKKKKKNRSELSMLLEAKRSQAQQSASKSLSLSEFMSS